MKEYQGFVTGSIAGRDDGYPETKRLVFDSIESLAVDPQRDQQVVYELVPVNTVKLQSLLAETKKRLVEKKAVDDRAKKEEEFERLKKELGK